MHQLVWPVLDGFAGDSDRDEALAVALAAYAESGITGSTDMALGEADYEAMRRADAAGALTTRIAAFWSVRPTGDEGRNSPRSSAPPSSPPTSRPRTCA